MMLQQLFGSQLALPIRVAIAVIVIGALLAVTVLVMRRLTGRSRSPLRSGRSGPRLAVLDSVAVDQRRRLVLVRRDEVEHLLLVGGNSDIVVEHQIAAETEEAAVAAAPALAATREAPGLQRPAGRRGLQAPAAPAALAPTAPVAAALAAEAAAPLPAPEPAPAVAVAPPAPAVAPPQMAEPRDDRRPLPSRRPLLRPDSPAPARPPLRGAVEAPPLVPPPLKPASQAPLMAAPAFEPDPIRPAPVEPRKVPEIKVPEIKAPDVELAPAARVEPAASEAPAPLADSRLDELAQRLDAALNQPAAKAEPQLSLADLLGESPAQPAEPDIAPKDIAPKAEPKAEAKSEPAAEPVLHPDVAVDSPQVRPTDRPLSRFLYQARTRSEPRVGTDVRPRLDPLPRVERPSEDSARPMAPARSEPPLRPREFAFRPVEPANREAPALDAPRREPPALREITREPARIEPQRPNEAASLARPEPAIEVKPEIRSEAKAADEAPVRAGFIPATSPKAADAGTDAPAAEPQDKDPLEDFDAEMASLLGRSSARGH